MLNRLIPLRKFAGISLLLVIYWLLALWMNSHVPLFEAPDAYYHFGVIEYRARYRTISPYDHPTDHPWRQMTFHARFIMKSQPG
jgi:hypothetical protein